MALPSLRSLPARSLAPWLMTLAAVPLGAAVAWQAWRVQRGARLGRRLAAETQAFEAHPPQPSASVLLLGDSTGVGVGAGSPAASLPGLLAQAYPDLRVVNRSRNGARVHDVLQQLQASVQAGERHDLALVLAGGNDVLRMTPHTRLRQHAQALLAALPSVARRAVWLGSANIGGSPLLKGPLSWWLGWQTGRTMRLLANVARAQGTEFIDFFRPLRHDLFARQAGIYFARDGLHPSAASYRHCFEVLMHRAPLSTRPMRRARRTTPQPPWRNTMPNVSDIMSTDVQIIGPEDSLRHAAERMQELDVGALPVCDGTRLLGMLTDRDIIVRGVAEGLDPEEACVSDVMTSEVEYCTEDQDTEEVMRLMGDKQVRRLPVVNADKKLVGIVSMGDMALRQAGHIDQTMRQISEPGGSGAQGRL